MANYIEVRTLSIVDVRNLCITNNWYTMGSCEDYSNMFSMCHENNITTADILKIARDILLHTDIDYETKYGCTSNEFFENICFLLIKACCTYVELC